ncbi:MAG: hypothetical protein QXO71_11215, partial [Candidatus Jordarchaeaceae archaeon]
MQGKDRIKKTLKIILEAGYQVTPEALKILSQYENPEDIAKELISKIEEKAEEIIVIDNECLSLIGESLTSREIEKTETIQIENQTDKTTKPEEGILKSQGAVDKKTETKEFEVSNQFQLTQGIQKRCLAKDVDTRFEVIFDPTGRIKGKGTYENFINYFRDRYMRIYNIFLKRGDIENLSKLSEIKKNKDKQIKIIGMITSIQKAKSGNIMIELEDLESTIKAIILEKNSDTISKAEHLMLDQVICFDGYLSNDMFIVNDFLWPDIPIKRELNKAEDPICAAFISDTHFGSKKFLDDSFKRFVQWLKGQVGDEK